MDTVTIAEAARRLGVSPETIRSRIRSGDLQSGRAATAGGFSLGVVLEDEPVERAVPQSPDVEGAMASQEPPATGPRDSEIVSVRPDAPVHEAAHLEQAPTVIDSPPEPVAPYASPAGGSGGPTQEGPSIAPQMEAPRPELPTDSPAEEIPSAAPHVTGNGSEMPRERPPFLTPYLLAERQESTNGGGTVVAEREPEGDLRLHLQHTDPPSRTMSQQGTTLPELAAALQSQIIDQKVELMARRREIADLHAMIHELHAWALGSGASPATPDRSPWWQRMFRAK